MLIHASWKSHPMYLCLAWNSAKKVPQAKLFACLLAGEKNDQLNWKYLQYKILLGSWRILYFTLSTLWEGESQKSYLWPHSESMSLFFFLKKSLFLMAERIYVKFSRMSYPNSSEDTAIFLLLFYEMTLAARHPSEATTSELQADTHLGAWLIRASERYLG